MQSNCLLVDTEWCTGCRTCEVACQMIKRLPVNQYGMKITEIGPWQKPDGGWELMYAPAITSVCDMCKDRTELGMTPSCVKHCQAVCLEYGTLEEMTKKLTAKPHAMLLMSA